MRAKTEMLSETCVCIQLVAVVSDNSQIKYQNYMNRHEDWNKKKELCGACFMSENQHAQVSSKWSADCREKKSIFGDSPSPAHAS